MLLPRFTCQVRQKAKAWVDMLRLEQKLCNN